MFPDLGIFSLFVYLVKVIFVLFCFVLIRGVLPRYRYDQLMMLGWTILMPVAFGLFFFHIAVFFFFFV